MRTPENANASILSRHSERVQELFESWLVVLELVGMQVFKSVFFSKYQIHVRIISMETPTRLTKECK